MRKKLDTSLKQDVCPKHNDLLTVYCETCQQVICRDCTISKEHKTHDWNLISECYPEHHQQIQDGLQQINQQMNNMDVAVSHLDATEKEVLQQGEQLTKEINTHAQKMIDQIVESCKRLSQKLNVIIQQKTHTLRAQKQQAHKIHTQLKTCQETIERNLKEWNQLQILAEKREMLKEMKSVTQNVNPKFFEPLENANVKLVTSKQIPLEIGTISSTTYGKATLHVPEKCFDKKSYIATLSLQSQDGSPFPLPTPSLISSTFSSPGSSNSDDVKCNVTQTNPGEYNITFTPTALGTSLLTVQVGGVDIPNSPFTLPVIPIRERPVMTIKGLDRPEGIAVCANGDIVVAEYSGDCITLFNKKGEKIKSIQTTQGEFDRPYGVAISNDGHILATDRHRLQKLTTDGVCVKWVGSGNHGNGQLEFNLPRGVAVHPTTGEIFVADCVNNRIQVFNGADLSFSHTIRHENILCSWDIAVDSEGCHLYITDSNTNNVYKFTTTGQYIGTIATIQNATTMYLAIHNQHIYISDSYSDRVLIYKTNGKLLHSFGTRGRGEGELCMPAGITVDTSGNVYVCDWCNNRIVVY